MKNKAIITSVAIGVAALTAAGVILCKLKKDDQLDSDYADEYKSKLNSLKRKAKREFKNTSEEMGDNLNVAKERATQWINKSGANI